ncbi:type I restriction-modification system subunit M [Lutibacter maritimus]|uniref:site-specific DNA-methyltransferase (adenine-specific) n=1 Tax=Lutibacter maritimus TaxID=593133 RepID=A0A1I6REM1_9FLAO|nr:type I restriction-modification system subunit M [Lutibacter maritimus]SFS63095.1 type I restriction enzyme M protein [Lutibacter maritimus]
MAIKKSELYSSLWASCDELRGGMDPSQYKDYVLVMLFLKYISDKWAGKPYAPITIPEGSSFDDLKALKGNDHIGDLINKKIIGPIAKANQLSDMPDFDDVTKLGDGTEMVERLTNLIAIFEKPELDFSGNRAEGDDILGDAYEYLMRNFATESGKSKGQFYTPAEISRTMAMIIGIDKANTSANTTIYDPTCGSGSLLLKVGVTANSKLTLYGQEKEATTAGLARMNMILHDYPTAEIKQGNTLSKPLFEENGNLKQFDFVVANPPFSDKRWSSGLTLPEDGKYNRFADYGVPPSKNGDFAYLLHIVRSLKRNGKGAVILPHGVLFRGNAEEVIRKNLIIKGYIKGIIGLPPNLFYGTGIPASIILIDKEYAANRKGIFMVDAGKGFAKDGNKNRLREQDIRMITDIFNSQIEIPGYSKMVSVTEIQNNEYNLNIPRYIESQDKEDIQDIEGHLKGGIPNVDIEDLNNYWQVYPSLKSSLFQPLRTKYSSLKIKKEYINQTIFEHPEFVTFSNQMDELFATWKTESITYLKGQDVNCHPKSIIKELDENILTKYQNKPLVNKYNMYQHLLTYWNDTMQDDCYIISYDGWKAETYRIYKENTKKVMVDKGWTCDLVPKDLVTDRFFPDEKLEIDNFNANLETIIAEYTELQEEHSGEEAALKDVTKKTDAQTNLIDFIDVALSNYFPKLFTSSEDLKEDLRMLIIEEFQLKNNAALEQLKNGKGNITKKAITDKLANANCSDDEKKVLNNYVKILAKKTKVNKELKALNEAIEIAINKKIEEDSQLEYIFEITILRKYIQLKDDETAVKKEIKEAEDKLDALLYAKYPTLTAEEIKTLVVVDKWMVAIENAVKSEIDNISQRLTNRIKELTERYETPLPLINTETSLLENKVSEHLKKMGFVWN